MYKRDVMSRLGGSPVKRSPTVEFVNRAGERVNPHNGKPYSRANKPSLAQVATNGVVKRKRVRKNNVVRSGGSNNFPIKTFGIMFGGLDPIPTNPTIDPPPRVCYNCWQQGHERKKCTRPLVAKICNNCGRRGVDLTTCPRCRVANMRHLAAQRGEKLEEEELAQMFPDRQFQTERVYSETSALDDGIDETIQQLIDQEERERELNNYYDEQERQVESPYHEPQVKYVETREYVKNPVSRQRSYEEDEMIIRHREDYDYEDRRERESYDERQEREKYSRYRDRESSEERSVERNRRAGNASNSDLDSDPVQDILQLAKSIAHLSPETQELIMKQVMAERKEKARLRSMAVQDRVVDEDWP